MKPLPLTKLDMDRLGPTISNRILATIEEALDPRCPVNNPIVAHIIEVKERLLADRYSEGYKDALDVANHEAYRTGAYK